MGKGSRPIITLTTDFGEGYYVGAMKGAMLEVCPEACIVDITHGIRSHDVLDGGFHLLCSYPYFPAQTVHVVVVDPGVGSERRGIVVATEKHYFVGPDNGVFSFVYSREPVKRVISIESQDYFRKPVSPTFHGRDVFAPVAAWLARGTEIEAFGEQIEDYLEAAVLPVEKVKPNRLEGAVIYVDKFGNIITNITPENVSQLLDGKGSPRFFVNGQQITHHYRFYAEASPEEVFSLVGSSGYYEISAPRKPAADILGVKRGEKVQLELG
ncbi:SAM-dependent chlorinase/fluorinase [Acidobacteria bacterium AH-259-D05]|nr:SAM-dependent chlorinase/fluorinase [Acidobacteria bacterium AH-259-D05]